MHRVVRADDLRKGTNRTVAFEGRDHDSGVSFYYVDMDHGRGPGLHRHPYSETWLVIEGGGTFVADGEELEASPGDIIVATAGTPHKFISTSEGPLRMVCIHASPEFIQEELE